MVSADPKALRQIRLLKPYRGYRTGQSVTVPPELADRLIATGTACHEATPQPGLFTPERADATPAAETR